MVIAVGAVGGGEKLVHFGGQLDALEPNISRHASGVKAARKRAGGLALTPLAKAGTQSSRGPKWTAILAPFLTATNTVANPGRLD
jgi:hypothetical protein